MKGTSIRAVRAGGALLLAAAAGCSAPVPEADDYLGSWQRAGGPGSVIRIQRVGGELRFDWWFDDGERKVRCDREGACIESVGGAAIFEHRFRAAYDAERGALIVEASGRPLDGDGAPRTIVDRLELSPGGHEIRVFTVARDGVPLDEPEPYRRYVWMAPPEE